MIEGYGYGFCSECGDSDDMIDGPDAIWVACHAHRRKWPIAAKSFSSRQTLEDQPAEPGWVLIEHYSNPAGVPNLLWSTLPPDGSW